MQREKESEVEGLREKRKEREGKRRGEEGKRKERGGGGVCALTHRLTLTRMYAVALCNIFLLHADAAIEAKQLKAIQALKAQVEMELEENTKRHKV